MAKMSIQNLIGTVEKARKPIAVEKDFVKDFEYAITENAKNDTHIPSRTFKPSSLGGCVRNLYFQLTGVQPKNSDASSMLVGICESGTDRHIRIQTHIIDMKNHGIDCEYIDIETFVKSRGLTDIEIVAKDGIETKCYNKKYNISFLTDGIIRYKGQYYILEIKTETDNKYWDHKDVRPEHVAQGVTYKISFGINQVLYLYENRSTTAHKAYVLDITEDMAKDIIVKMNFVNSCVENVVVPDKPIDAKCSYCGYKEECAKYAN